jgi:hypothetical protein
MNRHYLAAPLLLIVVVLAGLTKAGLTQAQTPGKFTQGSPVCNVFSENNTTCARVTCDPLALYINKNLFDTGISKII